jgi:uncharacterized membrane protein (UPF0127 family)
MKRVLLIVMVVALGACTPSRPAPQGQFRSLPQGTVSITRGGRTELKLSVAIAGTEQARDTGLMGVTTLGAHDGMAFVFGAPTSVNFWMKDTLIPLDIAFWDARGIIVTTYTMVPCTADPCHQYAPSSAYVGAVEMGSGLLARSGVTVGDSVQLTR